MRVTERGRLTDRNRTLTATGRNITDTYGETGRIIDPGSPLLYAAQYDLRVWLQYKLGIQYGATLKATGTSPPAWTISGTPTRLVGLHLEIDSVAGGTGLGQATYKWSENNGTSYVATGVLTAAGPTALGTTGLTVSMAVGPYNIDNKYDITVAQWDNLAGNGLHAANVDAAQQPVYDLVLGPTFDGVLTVAGDRLPFSNTLSAGSGASFFASFAVAAGAADNRIMFAQHERYYYQRTAASNTFQVQFGGSLATCGIALTSSFAIVESVDRAPNDVTFGVNGVLVTDTSLVGYNGTGAASVGPLPIINNQTTLGSFREIAFFGRPVPAAVATEIRRGMAYRTGVTL